MTVFVGRKREIRQAIRALRNKRDVFVHGPFGIGKTTFGRQVQRELGVPMLCVSLQSTPKQMAETIAEALTAHDYRTAVAEGRGHRTARASRASARHTAPVEVPDADASFYQLKRRLREVSGRHLVIVLDNFFKVTRQKLVFLDFLLHQGCRFIINIESDTDGASLYDLRALCNAHERIELPRLNIRESREMVAKLCRAYGLETQRFDSEAWVRQFNGYPLMIAERLKTNLRETQK